MNPPVRLIWLLMLGSVVVLGVVSLGVLTPVGTPDPKLLGTLVPVFALTAAMQFGLSVAFPRIAREGTPLFQRTVVRGAICEATAGLGLVLRLLGAAQTVVLGFFIAAFVGVLLARPPADDAA